MWPAVGRDGWPGDGTTLVRAPGSYDLQGSIVTTAYARDSSGPAGGSGSILPLAKRMLRSRRRSADERVTCIACGTSLPREAAREYDKLGDRWDREDKRFEYLCKPCHGDLNHQPRAELESLLVDLDAGDCSREAFLQWYCALVEERYGRLEDDH